MTATAEDASRTVLLTACGAVGISAAGATLIRAGENMLYRLPGHIVARVTRPGQQPTATKEVAVSRWLAAVGFPVVRVVPGIAQPVNVNGRAVTFWRELPVHTPGSPVEVGRTLRQLHDLPVPTDMALPNLDPLVRLPERIAEARLLLPEDRAWLTGHLDELTVAWAVLPAGLPWCAVHGDAWGGNIVSTDAGMVVLDLERFAFGPPEWDLTAIAVDFENYADMTAGEWKAVCDGYGIDVTRWAGYDTMRAIRELRKVTFAFQIADADPAATDQARYRLSCIQGREGRRPWRWVGVVA